ncbi:MAG: LdpA C-terminal domain-containing domain, partial [Cyanobacteria bacterium P01_F01_bin.42]
GADCIDVAADPAVIRMAREALAVAKKKTGVSPWLMVSINDGEDPHFRKANFNPQNCPPSCSQPCITVCPADAITLASVLAEGVLSDRCYGCGRCLNVCPSEQINAISHQVEIPQLTEIFAQQQVDAIEIHTQVGHEAQFQSVWQQLQPIIPKLRLLAISCPYHREAIAYLHQIQDWITPLPCQLLWQTDGRPMSGDIGAGTTNLTIKYAQIALQSRLHGFIQVAGGTNGSTVDKLNALGLLQDSGISGIAYGSYGRTLFDTLQATLDQSTHGSSKLEDHPQLLKQAVRLAHSLVSTLKPQRRLSEEMVLEFSS